MPTFDPLTADDLQLLAELTAAPINISSQDMLFTERGKALTYLWRCDYAVQKVTHVSREPSASIFTVTATGKAPPSN